MGLTVDSSQLMFLPSSKSHDVETRPNIKKNGLIKFRYCAPALRISGQLPALIVNGRGDSC